LRDNEPVPLTGKCFETLLVLIEHSSETVSKDVLMKTVWPDTFVEESNLTQHISMLRKALGESPQDRLYIVTVPGQGYRFVAEVREVAELSELESDVAAMPEPRTVAPGPVASPAPDGIRRLTLAVVFVVLFLVAVVGYLWPRSGHKSGNPPSTDSASIAVLPFADLSHSKDEEYFSDGLSEELINHLARVPGLKVVARSSAFQFKGKNEDLRLVGQKLGVANILEGSVRREGNRVRITTDLTKADDGFQLWSETYDRQIGDIFAVQDEIARAVTKTLQVRLLAPPGGPTLRGTDPEAYQAYLQGQYFFRRGEDKADLEKALAYADQAIKLDVHFARARALRSDVLNTMATIGLLPRKKGFDAARKDAEEAVTLDPNLAAGYVALAWVGLNYDWDWEGAEVALKKAAALEPGGAEVLSYRSYLYESLGRLDEAIALTEQATVLDPLRTNAYLGELLFYDGRYEEAKAALNKALALNPRLEGVRAKRSMILLAQGDAQQALQELAQEPSEWNKLTGEALVYRALGRQEDSNTALSNLAERHRYDSQYQIAEIYAYRGEPDKAFEWLERAYLERDPGLNQLKVDPFLQSLRQDRRYAELLKKMRLPLN
jgi:TolB-like protein/DNA-binding winged helix-turn-helix (wHTH) protein/Flp pilus assembly protein TadD